MNLKPDAQDRSPDIIKHDSGVLLQQIIKLAAHNVLNCEDSEYLSRFYARQFGRISDEMKNLEACIKQRMIELEGEKVSEVTPPLCFDVETDKGCYVVSVGHSFKEQIPCAKAVDQIAELSGDPMNLIANLKLLLSSNAIKPGKYKEFIASRGGVESVAVVKVDKTPSCKKEKKKK